MLVFLDTEFTDSLDCELISIGMVSDGRYELYLERADYPLEWCNSFVRAAVLPQLGQAQPALNRVQLMHRLAAWFAVLPRNVTIACDSFTDWELLLDALDEMRPTNLKDRFDTRTLDDSTVFHRAVAWYHDHRGPWHHALHDARAHRMGWLAWMDARKNTQPSR